MDRLNLQGETIASRLQPKIRKTPWLKVEPLLCEWFKPGGNVTSRLWKGSSVGLIAAAEETVFVSDFLMRRQVRRNERLFGDAICSGPIRLHFSPLSTFWTTELMELPTLITLAFTLTPHVLQWPANPDHFSLFPWLPVRSLSHLDLSAFSCVLIDRSVVILTRYQSIPGITPVSFVERFSLTLKWLR